MSTSPTWVRRHGRSLYVTGVCAAGIALLVAALVGHVHTAVTTAEPTITWALVGCLLVTELRPVSWLRRTGGAEVTASWTFVFAILLVAPFALALSTLWFASLLGDVLRRKGLVRTLFNASQLVVSLAAGAAALELLAGSHLQPPDPSLAWVFAAVVAAAVIFTVNGVLMGLVLALHSRRPAGGVVRSVILLNLFTDGLLLTVAPIFVAIRGVDAGVAAAPHRLDMGGLPQCVCRRGAPVRGRP